MRLGNDKTDSSDKADALLTCFRTDKSLTTINSWGGIHYETAVKSINKHNCLCQLETIR